MSDTKLFYLATGKRIVARRTGCSSMRVIPVKVSDHDAELMCY